eukprot:366501-Chlamydomonas_euryale.AAC.38
MGPFLACPPRLHVLMPCSTLVPHRRCAPRPHPVAPPAVQNPIAPSPMRPLIRCAVLHGTQAGWRRCRSTPSGDGSEGEGREEGKVWGEGETVRGEKRGEKRGGGEKGEDRR